MNFDHMRSSLAQPGDAEAVHTILAEAGEHLAAAGFRNWLPPYPIDRVAADIALATVFVVRADETSPIIATYVLRPSPVQPYEPKRWSQPNAPARYLNRLAVNPARQGAGIGTWCLGDIDRRASDAGAIAIRCDVLAANERLCQFYERGGYAARGLRAHSGWTFSCYERLLAPT